MNGVLFFTVEQRAKTMENVSIKLITNEKKNGF